MLEESKCIGAERFLPLLDNDKVKKNKISFPGSKGGKESRKLAIEDQLERHSKNKCFSLIHMDENKKKITNYQVMVDRDVNRLIILLWCVDPELYPYP